MSEDRLPEYEDMKDPPIQEQPEFVEFLRVLKTNIEYLKANGSGIAGKSAYEIAVDEGFVGTEAAWLASLVGADGTNGTNGTNGTDGADSTVPGPKGDKGDPGNDAPGPAGFDNDVQVKSGTGLAGITGHVAANMYILDADGVTTHQIIVDRGVVTLLL